MHAARLTNTLLLAVAGLGLLGGATAWFAGSPDQAEWIWAGATVPVLVVVLAGMVRALFRGDVGVDLIAVLSMTGALRRVSVGSYAWTRERAALASWASHALRRMSYEGAASVFVAIDGEMRGALPLSDAIRPIPLGRCDACARRGSPRRSR